MRFFHSQAKGGTVHISGNGHSIDVTVSNIITSETNRSVELKIGGVPDRNKEKLGRGRSILLFNEIRIKVVRVPSQDGIFVELYYDVPKDYDIKYG